MTRLDMIPERAMLLAEQVGENLRYVVPPGAGKWLDAGMKIGALKTGARVAGKTVMRHPGVVISVAAGAGALWYLARRRAKQAANASDEGVSRRVEAKRGNGTGRTRTTTRKRSRKTASTD